MFGSAELFAQNELNKAKILLHSTGIGIGDEFNSESGFAVELEASTLLGILNKLSIAGKYTLFGNQSSNFRTKIGFEIADIIIPKMDYLYNGEPHHIKLMPLFQFEYKRIGFQIANYYMPLPGLFRINGLFPIIGGLSISLN